MQRHKLSLILLALVLVGLLAGGVMYLLRQSPHNDFTMPDGKVLRLEKVVYGKRDPFQQPVGWVQELKNKLVAKLPRQWTARIITPTPASFGSWWMNTTVHTNL